MSAKKMIVDPAKLYMYVPVSDEMATELTEGSYACLLEGKYQGINPLGVIARWRETEITHVLVPVN